MEFKKVTQIAFAVSMSLTVGMAQADSLSFDRLYTLGDSLTDGGAYSGAIISGGAPAGLYRWTNNAPDGSSLVYVEVLANNLGLRLPVRFITVTGPNDPSSGANGANYAQGGSRVAEQPGIGYDPANPFITTLPVSEQVDQLLTDRPQLSSKDLVILWAGANDGFTQFGSISSGASTTTAGLTNMAVAATSMATQIDRIKAAGGKNIVVMLVPDLAQTPFGALVTAANASGGSLLTALTGVFNQTLLTAATQRDAFVFDSNKVLTAVLADPTRFGFNVNTLGSVACGTNPSATGINDFYNTSLSSCFNNNPDDFLFADGVHPSSKAHELFGEILTGTLRGISQASSLLKGPMLSARQHSMEIEERIHLNAMANSNGESRTIGKSHVYGGATIGDLKESAGQIAPSEDATTQLYKIGIDQQFSTSMMGGFFMSYGNGKTTFGADTGRIKTRQVTATGYISKALSANTYMNVSVGMGTINHNFQRRISLDTTTLTANSKPNGRYQSFSLGGGGVYNLGDWKVGPKASLAYEKVSIDGFNEGSGAASMTFGEMNYTMQRLSLGLSIDQSKPVDQWRGFGRLANDWDLNNDSLQVRVGHALYSMGSIEVDRPKTQWRAELGLMRPASDDSSLSVSVGIGGVKGGGDIRTIGVSYRREM